MHRFIGPTDARGMFDEMPSPEKLQPNPTRNPSNQARHAHQRTPPPVGIHPGGCRAGRAQGNGRARTCVLAVLVGAGLGEDLEVDEAERHEAEGEPRHEPGEHHQPHARHQVHPEHRPAAHRMLRHLPPAAAAGESSSATTELRCSVRHECVRCGRGGPVNRFLSF